MLLWNSYVRNSSYLLTLQIVFQYEIVVHCSKKDGDSSSISEFFMSACNCDKGINGYFKWGCVSNKCKEWRLIQPPELKYQESSQPVTINRFEIVKSKYKVKDKITREVTGKISSRTERVSKSMTFRELYQMFMHK